MDLGPTVRRNCMRNNDSRRSDFIRHIFLGTPITTLAEVHSRFANYRVMDLDLNISRVAHANVRNGASFVVLVPHYRSRNCWTFFLLVFSARTYQSQEARCCLTNR